MPESKKLLLWLIAMMLIFLLLLVIIWLVYNYRMHQLDRQLERPALSLHIDFVTKSKFIQSQTTFL